MRYIVVFCIVFMSGCSSHQWYTATRTTQTSDHNFSDLKEELAYMGDLLEIGYKEPSEAIRVFSTMGIDASYFSPKYRFFQNYPEVFILSRRQSDHIIVLFVGTDSAGDWIQNAKTNNYSDTVVEGAFYIPAGHAGFRQGVINLIKHQFFTSHLDKHVEKYNVKSTGQSVIHVTLTGHSQGAALAQLATPIIDGYRYKNGHAAKAKNWPYEVQAVYAFAPPAAVSYAAHDWAFMSKLYSHLTYQVIRDSDFVTALYNAAINGAVVPVRHYGKLIRITRDDEVVAEDTFWGSEINASHKNKPHDISGYAHALKKALKKPISKAE